MKKLTLLLYVLGGLLFFSISLPAAPAKAKKAPPPKKEQGKQKAPAPKKEAAKPKPQEEVDTSEKELKPRVYHESAFASTFRMLDKITPDSGLKDRKMLTFEEHKISRSLSMEKLYKYFRCQIVVDQEEQRIVNLFSHAADIVLGYKDLKSDSLKPASLEDFRKYMEEGGCLIRAEACYDITVKRFAFNQKIICRNCGGKGEIIKYTFGDNASRECPSCAGKGFSVKNNIRKERGSQNFKKVIYHLVVLEDAKGSCDQEKKAVSSFYFPFDAPSDALSQFYAGRCYARGERTSPDFGKAQTLWRQAVEKKDRRALELWRRMGKRGDADSLYMLSLCFASGQGVAKDPARARRFLEWAAQKGNALAQLDLAAAYARQGTGDKKNSREAAQWARKAADQGLPRAQAYLGGCYLTGTGVPKNISQAKTWLDKAAKQGLAPAKDIMTRFSKGAKEAELKKKAAPLMKI